MNAYEPSAPILNLAWTFDGLRPRDRMMLALLGTYSDTSSHRANLYAAPFIPTFGSDDEADRCLRMLAKHGFIKIGTWNGRINEVCWGPIVVAAIDKYEADQYAEFLARKAAKAEHEARKAERRIARDGARTSALVEKSTH